MHHHQVNRIGQILQSLKKSPDKRLKIDPLGTLNGQADDSGKLLEIFQ